MKAMKFGEEYFKYCNDGHFDMNSIGDWQRQYFEMLRDIFSNNIGKNKQMLDFGCATGSLIEVFRRAGIVIFGCDVSQWYIDASPFKEIIKQMMVVENNILPFVSEQFDFIHSAQVIEHIPESLMIQNIMELKRVLKSDGIIYLSTVGEGPTVPEEGQDPTHISCFSEAKWNSIFEECGLKNVSEEYRIKFAQNPLAQKYDWVNFILTKTI